MRTKFSLINNYKKEIFFYLLLVITILYQIFGNKTKAKKIIEGYHITKAYSYGKMPQGESFSITYTYTIDSNWYGAEYAIHSFKSEYRIKEKRTYILLVSKKNPLISCIVLFDPSSVSEEYIVEYLLKNKKSCSKARTREKLKNKKMWKYYAPDNFSLENW